MKKELKDNNVLDKINVIDVETESGQKKYKNTNADGVPFFESQSTGKTVSGYMKFDHLLHKLQLS